MIRTFDANHRHPGLRAMQKTNQLLFRQFGKIQALILAEEGGSDG
jgi:hypothetical protein